MLSKKKVFIKDKDVWVITDMLDAYEKMWDQNKKELTLGNQVIKKGIVSIADAPGFIRKAEKTGDKWEAGEEWTHKEEKSLITEVQAINIKINGNYAKINKTVAEKAALGRATFFFRKYFTPFVTRRFAGRNGPKLNAMEDNYHQGYYIEGTRVLMRDILGGMLVDRGMAVGSFLDIFRGEAKFLSKKEVYSSRRLLGEMSFILLLNLLLIIPGFDDDEDYDEYSWAHLHLLYQIYKLKSETEQFFPIAGFDEMYRTQANPSLIIGISYNKFRRMPRDLYYMMTGDEKARYKRDTHGMWKEGDLKILADIYKSLGLRFDILYPEQRLRNFRYAERTR
jgi:hypothetical protein